MKKFFSLPRAITTALGITLVVYVLVAVAALHALGPAGLADATAPLSAVADTSGAAWPGIVIRVGAEGHPLHLYPLPPKPKKEAA